MGYLRICESSVTETVPSAARCMALLCALSLSQDTTTSTSTNVNTSINILGM